MGSRVRLAVDLMSGDVGPHITLPATLRAMRSHPGLHVCLVGDGRLVETVLAQGSTTSVDRSRISIVHTRSVLSMAASARDILKGDQDSSLHRTIRLLADGKVDGVTSAGNTAALLALGRRYISMLPGFSRPACCSTIPVDSGFRYMLDLGANVDCDADSLVEFARLGTMLIRSLEDCPSPRVALLSNGTETNKGNLAIREAAKRIQADADLNYQGFIEGDELHRAGPELVVCDGMLGNVALKSAEGVAKLAQRQIDMRFSRHWWLRLVSLAVGSTLKELRDALSAERHGGAYLLGLNGVVVKSHGGSSSYGFQAAVDQAARCVENRMVGKLARSLDAKDSGQQSTQEQESLDSE